MTSVYEQAKATVERHVKEVGTSLLSAWWIHHDDEVRLIEVDKDYPTFYEDYVQPCFTGEYGRVRCLIIISPEDWSRVVSGEAKLPKGWDKDKCQCLYERTRETDKTYWLQQVKAATAKAVEAGATKDELTKAIE